MNIELLQQITKYSVQELIELPDDRIAEMIKEVDQSISQIVTIKNWLNGILALRNDQKKADGFDA